MKISKSAGYALIALSYLGGWTWMNYDATKNDIAITQEAITIEIEKGDSFAKLTDKLVAQNVAIKPFWFKVLGLTSGAKKKIKKGEYELNKGLTAPEMISLFVQGKTKQHAITFPEGLNFKAVRQTLDSNPFVEHTLKSDQIHDIVKQLAIAQNHPEGVFFPDTYFFEKHTTDVAILKRAYTKMQQVLAQEWQQRDENISLKTAYQALVLASIIEKETAATNERAQISGVFNRRLEQDMMLQTDPTVIYGMGEDYHGDIKRSDLQNPTPYNTYTFRGLPPTPIAMPGQAAIHAALHPDTGDAIYFVAKGDGGHVFSSTLEAHNAAVNMYQRHKAEENL